MPRPCAFCPATANISGEHIWSDWMNALFPSGQVTFQKVEQDGSISKRWRSVSGLNMTANVVCKKCNETWMSAIEADHAKPAMSDLILGKPATEITPEQAHGISLFAFKTAVISNYSLPEDEEFFEISHRYAFRKSLSIPSKVGMWLLGFAPDSGGGIRSVNIYFPDKNSPKLTLNVCSFYVGQLGFQVVSLKSNTVTQIESLPTPDNLTVLFYPTLRGGVSWPRTVVLGWEVFDRFAYRWNSVKYQ
jgi:hypothetical protein